MRHFIAFLLDVCFIFLPVRWTMQALDAYDGDKVHLISCQRALNSGPANAPGERGVACYYEQAGFLGQPATKTPFQLRQISLKTYDTSCHEGDTCRYWMLSLATEQDAIEVKDFAYDRERAHQQRLRFEALLGDRPDHDNPVEMRYGNSWYKEVLKILLFLLLSTVWVTAMAAAIARLAPASEDD
jgi:hypothetical protein